MVGYHVPPGALGKMAASPRILITGAAGNLGSDFLRIGRVPYCGDTARTRRELLPELRHPTLSEGLGTLRPESSD